MVRTLRLGRCTCGDGYIEDRTIPDIMTNDGTLRKDCLSKDLSLTEVLEEGEANDMTQSRTATVEGKSSIHKLVATAGSDGDAIREEEEHHDSKAT